MPVDELDTVYLGSGAPPFAVGDCDVYVSLKDMLWSMVCVARGREVEGLLEAYLMVTSGALVTFANHSCLTGLFVPEGVGTVGDELAIGMWVLCRYSLTSTSRLGIAKQIMAVLPKSSAIRAFEHAVKRGSFSREVLQEIPLDQLGYVLDVLLKAPTHTEWIKKYGKLLGVSEEFLRWEDYPFEWSIEDTIRKVVRVTP